jgi:hypothetical protein
MQINLDEAIKIYAKACQSRFGRAARKKVLETAAELKAKGDPAGARVWEQVAAEVDRGPRRRGQLS